MPPKGPVRTAEPEGVVDGEAPPVHGAAVAKDVEPMASPVADHGKLMADASKPVTVEIVANPATADVSKPMEKNVDVVASATTDDPKPMEKDVEMVTSPTTSTDHASKPMDRCSTKNFDDDDDGSEAFAMLVEAIGTGDLQVPMNTLPCFADQLVSSPSLLPPWIDENHAEDLKTCLSISFDEGFKPDSDITELSKQVVTWMKQISETPCHTIWGAEFQKGLEGFQKMKNASDHLHQHVSTAVTTMKALAKAAMKSFEDSKALYTGKPNLGKALATKSAVLQKWVTNRQLGVRRALDAAVERRDQAAKEFEALLGRLAQDAYDGYLADHEPPTINEDALFEDLDACVSMATVEPPEQVAPKPDETPEEVAPQSSAFEKIVASACGLSGAKITPDVHAKLVKQMGDTFTKLVFPERAEHHGATTPKEVPSRQNC